MVPGFPHRTSGPGHYMGQFDEWGGVRLALLALSSILAFAQSVVDNANNTDLTPLAHGPCCDQARALHQV